MSKFLSVVFCVACLCTLLADEVAAQPSFEFLIQDCKNPVAKIVTNDLNPGDPGAQGWSMSIAAVGCTITNATTAGTVVPDLFEQGFEKTELATCPNGLSGAVSAVVALLDPVTLDPGKSPHEVLRLNFEETDSEACTLFFLDGCKGSGQAVKNAVTYYGNAFTPTFKELVCFSEQSVESVETFTPTATEEMIEEAPKAPVAPSAPAPVAPSAPAEEEPPLPSCSLTR